MGQQKQFGGLCSLAQRKISEDIPLVSRVVNSVPFALSKIIVLEMIASLGVILPIYQYITDFIIKKVEGTPFEMVVPSFLIEGLRFLKDIIVENNQKTGLNSWISDDTDPAAEGTVFESVPDYWRIRHRKEQRKPLLQVPLEKTFFRKLMRLFLVLMTHLSTTTKKDIFDFFKHLRRLEFIVCEGSREFRRFIGMYYRILPAARSLNDYSENTVDAVFDYSAFDTESTDEKSERLKSGSDEIVWYKYTHAGEDVMSLRDMPKNNMRIIKRGILTKWIHEVSEPHTCRCYRLILGI